MTIGTTAPTLRLPDTAGADHDLVSREGAAATVIVFTCNHCPYALAWHDRIAAVADDYQGNGIAVWCISPNDAERYPADGPDKMRERVETEGWRMPYLYDESQEVAAGFGARTTPDVFVLDGDLRVRYRGAPDGDYEDPSQNAAWLREALDDLIAGREVARPESEPVGCSIKWRS